MHATMRSTYCYRPLGKDPHLETNSVSGFSLLETVLAVAIFASVIAIAGFFFQNSSKAMSSLANRAYATSRLQSVMDRVITELVSGRFASMVPPIPEKSQWMRFQKVVAPGSPPTYGNPIQIELVQSEEDPVDGQDNDSNGLIDEARVQVWEDFPPHGPTPGEEDAVAVLAINLTNDGLTFTREGAVLLIAMTFQSRPERERPLEFFTLRSGIRMRNSN